MRGSISHQCGRLSVEVNEIGSSKYEAKEEARQNLIAGGSPATSETIAERTGIYSAQTLDNYFDRWVELGTYAKEELGIRDMEKLNGEAVKTFLAEKMELGVSYSHFSQYCAAFGKLEQAIENFSKDIKGIDRDLGFRTVISELRADARKELPRFEGTRNYDSPDKLISSLSGASSLVASIQLESGARLSEASRISANQLKEIGTDTNGKMCGQFNFSGKGGRDNVGNLSPETYQALVNHIEQHGSLNLSADTYRNDLKTASTATGQDYNGSHGLRWSFAQGRMSELQSKGIGYTQALGQVSSEMGHNRIEITEHYLGK